ncbi:MAG: hypothetical protein AMJ54_15035 [Deltaproteobacteria bacterium SG8_13]|nr:MAG: hypothetical protein AMJ54_15035 [Deltaproteobacteria bacterium SG8_13]
MTALADVRKGFSYKAAGHDPAGGVAADDDRPAAGSPSDGSLLVLGLMHPPNDPRLDWWERGDSWGNRRLREISDKLRQWLRDAHGLKARPLPYHLEKGGIFLKDAAVLSGLGVIGQSNLLLHPQWGPRIRLRSIWIAADLPPTAAITGFNPCETCERYCQKACPVGAFPEGRYSRPKCYQQMDADVANEVAEGEVDPGGNPAWVIKYCRQCELTCPVGA